jgi:hypothetical protein
MSSGGFWIHFDSLWFAFISADLDPAVEIYSWNIGKNFMNYFEELVESLFCHSEGLERKSFWSRWRIKAESCVQNMNKSSRGKDLHDLQDLLGDLSILKVATLCVDWSILQVANVAIWPFCPYLLIDLFLREPEKVARWIFLLEAY